MKIDTHSILSPIMERLHCVFSDNTLICLKSYFAVAATKSYDSYESLYISLLNSAMDFQSCSPCNRIDAIVDFCVAIDSVYLEKGIGASAHRRCVVWDILFRLKPYLSECESKQLLKLVSPIDKHIFSLGDEQEQAIERQRFIFTVFKVLSTECRHPVPNRIAFDHYVSSMNLKHS